MEGLSLRARYKAIEILLTRKYIPPEVTQKYICPNVGLLCGCLDHNKWCNNILKSCIRCGRIIVKPLWGYTSHYCSNCKCLGGPCPKANTYYSYYCIEHNSDNTIYIQELYNKGLFDINKLIKVAEKMNDTRLVNFLRNGKHIIVDDEEWLEMMMPVYQ